MAHKHELYDTDGYFIVDADTRLISVDGGGKPTVVQKDHNSERFTFEIPRYIDEHDMSLCNRAEIHYINVGNGRKFSGLYEIEDLQVDPEDENLVLCTWLVSQNATQVVGTLNFVLHLACTTDDTIDYSWHTAIYTGVQVLETIDNTGQTVEQYPDILEQWRVSLVEAGILAADMAAARTAEQIAATMERFHGSVTLPASGWTEGKQTVVIDGMKQDSAIVFTPASLEDRAAASEASLFVTPIGGEPPDEYEVYETSGAFSQTVTPNSEGFADVELQDNIVNPVAWTEVGIRAVKAGYSDSRIAFARFGDDNDGIFRTRGSSELPEYVKGSVFATMTVGSNRTGSQYYELSSLSPYGVKPGDECYIEDTRFTATYVNGILTAPVGTTFRIYNETEGETSVNTYTVALLTVEGDFSTDYQDRTVITVVDEYSVEYLGRTIDVSFSRVSKPGERLEDVAAYYPYESNVVRITGGCTKTKVEFSAKTIPTKDITLDYVMTDIKMNEVTT